MKLPLSLKWFVALSFLVLGLVLVVGYSWLAAHNFILGMDNMLATNMEQAARRYLATVPEQQKAKGPREFEGFLVTPTWSQLPAEIREAFGAPPAKYSELARSYRKTGTMKPPLKVYFLMRYRQGEHDLFINHNLSRATAPSLLRNTIRGTLKALLLISVACALTLAAIVWLLLKRVSGPVARLGNWTRALTPKTLKEPVPDFAYPELNKMAALIRNSLASVEQSLEREHRFLRHASHELRTPITTLRTNIELLGKLKGGAHIDPREQLAMARIDRASLTMKHLTETLLWLGRDNGEPLPEKTFSLDQLLQQLAGDLGYLLRNREVTLDIDTEPCEVTLPEVAARIVLGNLIRNAFQHTPEGSVSICQRGRRVEIVNRQREVTGAAEDLGFGLGLQLTAQLTERLGWHYDNRALADGHRAVLELVER